MKEIAYSKDAVRTLSRLPANVSMLIRSKIEQYATDPGSLANNVKTLRNELGLRRLRVGDWRVLFDDSGAMIAIIKIGSRGEVYD